MRRLEDDIVVLVLSMPRENRSPNVPLFATRKKRFRRMSLIQACDQFETFDFESKSVFKKAFTKLQRAIGRQGLYKKAQRADYRWRQLLRQRCSRAVAESYRIASQLTSALPDSVLH